MDMEVITSEPGAQHPSRLRRWLQAAWLPIVMVTSLALSLVAPQAAFAAQLHGHFLAAGNNIPAVKYGAGNTGITSKVVPAMQNIARTIQLLLGGTALVVILVAAIMNHFVHDPQAKQRAKELIGAAVVGLLLAAFAPAIVNFLANL